MGLMSGKKGIIFGVSNTHGIAYGIAQQLYNEGADIAFTYAGEAMEKRVKPIAEDMNAKHIALGVSAYSLVTVCRHAEPIMNEGSSIFALTYLGSVLSVPSYNVMGVAKAALESAMRFLAVDLGPKGIRVNCLSSGPVKTLASMGIAGFSKMLKAAVMRAPMKKNVSLEDVGRAGLYLASDLSSGTTGEVIYCDCGCHSAYASSEEMDVISKAE